jgi:K+-transporting ATPase A subunit
VLLPISIVVALFFVWQGMPQNLGAYVDATTLEGQCYGQLRSSEDFRQAAEAFGTKCKPGFHG